MADRPNRCPHCWAALPPTVGVLCPHCARPVEAAKTKRRLGTRLRAGESKARPDPAAGPASTSAAAPVAEPGPREQFVPAAYVPPATSNAPAPPSAYTSPPAAPPLTSNAPAPPSAYTSPAAPPLISDAPAPPSAYMTPGESLVPAAPVTPEVPAGREAVAVAVLERDRHEFPGTPLPADFFTSFREEQRRNSISISPRLVRFGAVAVVVLVGLGFAARDRADDVTSPARHLVASACAEYRDFSIDIGPEWYVVNADRFDAAARLDPELAPAAEFMTWFRGALETGPDALADLSDEEFAKREQPLVEACWDGPGRA